MDVLERAKDVILSPAAAWRKIEPESGDAGALFVNYAAFLAAIPPVCAFLRHGVFGWGGARLHHPHPGGVFSSLFSGVVHYFVTFAVLYAMAVLIDGLAPNFSARKNQHNAMKLAVYSMTPIWLAGVFELVPGLGLLRLLALLYAIFVFWLGLPILMKSPPDRTGPYALACVVCAIILSIVVSAIVGPVV